MDGELKLSFNICLCVMFCGVSINFISYMAAATETKDIRYSYL